MNNEGRPLKNWRKDFINNLSIPHTLKERCSLKLTSCLAYCSELMVKGPRVRFSRLLLSRIARSPVMVALLPLVLSKWSAIHPLWKGIGELSLRNTLNFVLTLGTQSLSLCFESKTYAQGLHRLGSRDSVSHLILWRKTQRGSLHDQRVTRPVSSLLRDQYV